MMQCPAQVSEVRFDGLCVLLVDDNNRLRGIMGRALESLGCAVTAADSANAAIRCIESGCTPRLLLSDIRMPGPMDGLGLARWVSAHHPEVAIVLITGFTQVADIPFELISKPFGPDELVESLSRALGREPQPGANDSSIHFDVGDTRK